MAEQDQNTTTETPDGDSGVTDSEARQLLNVGDDGTAGNEQQADGGGSEKETTDWEAEATKWKKLSRKNETDFKATAAKLKEFEDKGKTESQRLLEERDSFKSQAEKNAAELRRMAMAVEHAPDHATPAQLRKVAKRLRGDSDEELEADAKELWEDFAPSQKQPVAGKPKERLRGGGDPDDAPDELDPAKLAARIPRAR